MTEFEQQLQQIVTRNWPLNKMQERFANVYAQAVSMVEADANVQVPGIWRAIYRYESRLHDPDSAMERITRAEAVIPERELFQLKLEYFNQTGQPDRLADMCGTLIAQRKLLAMAYQNLILLHCRSGHLQEATAVLEKAANEDLRGALGTNIRFSHMLGAWDMFEKLVDTFASRADPDDLNLRRWRTVLDWIASPASREFPFPHHFVNLDRAKGRRRALEERYARYGDPLNFVQAVDGSKMGQDIYDTWCPTGKLHIGGVANLQSQMSVWRAFLETTNEHALIFEDDAWPYADMATWSDLTQLVETENPDMVFINDRGAGVWWDRPDTPPWTTYAEAIGSYTDNMRAPGLDGYLLSRRGAQMLLDNFEQDRVFTNIDWQTASYTLTHSQVGQMPQGIQRNVVSAAHDNMKSTARLSAYVLNRPVVCQFAAGHATVNETNMLVQQSKTKQSAAG
ncbi:hypothetical protein GCM10007385_44590 [Tateyamaria omphalii]|uniref:hypothetical protein n=1 Tax=Tateyamaria omphalii TaxID=299262 RepID=UPI00167646A7|nr:hypothetical protein [Tateyamaria omphalii]GGX70615.1 hypothetical protein GCM10007385_44590 [Tateyamaria omphalii]